MSQVQHLEEAEPDSSRSLRTKLQQNDDDAESVDDSDKVINCLEEAIGMTSSSLDASATNGEPSSETSSCPTSAGYDTEHGAKSPIRKRKSLKGA